MTTAESAQFGANSIPFDGLMGLAKSLLSEQKVPTPIEALKSAGTVASAQMGYHLARRECIFYSRLAFSTATNLLFLFSSFRFSS